MNFIDNNLVNQATVLDPRFKHKGFRDDKQFKSCCKSILEEMDALNSKNISIETAELTEVTKENIDETESIWAEYDDEEDPKAVIIGRSSNEQELDSYLAEPLCRRADDPLDWWKLQKNKYPTLYEVMLQKLCIPASSVPCERVFSKAGEIETSKRNRLSSNKFQKILFIKQNRIL